MVFCGIFFSMPYSSTFSSDSSAKRWALLLCLLAIGSLLCAQALHSHLGPSALSDQNHCSVCAAIYASVVVICAAFLLWPSLAAPRCFQYSDLELHCVSAPAVFALFSRPPPLR